MGKYKKCRNIKKNNDFGFLEKDMKVCTSSG
jgi:hypothetical protein